MRKDTSAALKKYGISAFFAKKTIEEAEELIDESENVILVLITNYDIAYPDPTKRDIGAGIVMATDKKIVVYCKVLRKSISFIVPVSEIQEILLIPKINGTYTIQVITAERIFNFPLPASGGSFRLESPKDFATMIYKAFMYSLNQKEFAAFSKSTTPTEKTTDITEQIEKLAGLKDKGIITEEEFQSKKEELLSRI